MAEDEARRIAEFQSWVAGKIKSEFQSLVVAEEQRRRLQARVDKGATAAATAQTTTPVVRTRDWGVDRTGRGCPPKLGSTERPHGHKTAEGKQGFSKSKFNRGKRRGRRR